MQKPVTTFILPVLLASFAASTKFPTNFRKCAYGKPDFNQCVAEATQAGTLLLTQPIKSAGLPSLEPLDMPAFSINAGDGPVGVQEQFENAKMFGLRHVNIRRAAFTLEPDNMWMNSTGLFPKLEIKAEYRASGKVMLLPVEGHGNATIVLTNLTVVLSFPIEKIQKKGKTHLRITPAGNVKLPNLGHLSMNFENLYNGNKELGETFNQVINDNWEAIFDDVRSGYENLFTAIIVSTANRFFARVPLAEMIDNAE